MPALRNRFHPLKGPKSDEEHKEAKLLALEGKAEFKPLDQQQRNELIEESFGDVQTASKDDSRFEDQIQIFSDTQEDTSGWASGWSARDQFATAMLKLQVGLEDVGNRVANFERQIEILDGKCKQKERQKDSKSIGGNTLVVGLMYLVWPVVVFVAARAIERRNISAVISKA